MYHPVVKRALDLALAVAALLLLAPVLLCLWTLVGRFTGTPVLFRQARSGFGGRPFSIIKFRTMTDARDTRGHLLPDSDRLTRFGGFLRRTSLDELPELINILKGEMSFVGPRPLLCKYLELYSPVQARRHLVKPGITGWAQVHGRNALNWEERFALDVWYVDNRSIGLDLRILSITVWKVLRREGINQVGHTTMPEFLGSGASTAPSTRS
jgi:lipopolysaccharide/colanic/teichoic acid biosynthesis glycosyltransferase